MLSGLLTWSWRSTADLPRVVVICPHSSDDRKGLMEATWKMGDAHVSQTALLRDVGSDRPVGWRGSGEGDKAWVTRRAKH